MHDKGPKPFMDASHPTVCYSAAFLRGRKARNALRLQISIKCKGFWVLLLGKEWDPSSDRSPSILYECLVLGFFAARELHFQSAQSCFGIIYRLSSWLASFALVWL